MCKLTSYFLFVCFFFSLLLKPILSGIYIPAGGAGVGTGVSPGSSFGAGGPGAGLGLGGGKKKKKKNYIKRYIFFKLLLLFFSLLH